MSDNLQVYDANSTQQYIRTTETAGVHVPHHIVDSSPALTDTQLRATPVPVSLDSIALTELPAQHVDSFSRVRVSNPAYRFDAQITYQINSDVWDTKTAVSGGVAHDGTLRAATLTASASNGSQAILQSHYSPPYTPGRSHLAFLTFLFGSTPASGISRRAGLYAENDDSGIYIEQTSSAVNLVLKSGTGYATQTVPQASWNLDPMDGNGPSGHTLNLGNVQILVISYQALYVGMVTIAFDIDGQLVPVHQFKHSNRIALPYIANASLPVHFSIRTTAAAGDTMKAICASVISEGGSELENMPGRSFSVNNGTTVVPVTTARQSVLTIQCQQQLNTINQRAIVIPQSVDVVVSGTDAFVEILRNATVTSLSASTSIDANSTVFVDRAARAISASGTVIDSFYVNSGNTGRSSAASQLAGKVVLCYSHLLAAGDTLTVAVTRNAGAGTCNALASLRWKEIR